MVVMLPQLVVSAHYLANSYRIEAVGYAAPGQKISYANFSKAFNVNIHEFANLIDPVSYPIRDGNNMFIGLVPLMLILFGLTLGRHQLKRSLYWQKNSFFIGLLFIFSLVAMLGYVTWFAVVLYKLPFVYEIRQLGRYAILFDLSLTLMLAGIFEVVSDLKLDLKQRFYIVAGGIFLAINGLYLYLLRSHIFSTHHALQTELLGLALVAIAALSNPKWRRVGLGLAVITALFVNTLWFLPKPAAGTELPSEYRLPSKLTALLESTNGKYRVEIVDNSVPPNIGNVYNIQTVSGYSATIYSNYYRFWRSGLNNELVGDLLGVKYLVTKNKAWGSNPVYADNAHLVYVFNRVTELPKAFVSDKNGSLNRSDYHGLNAQTLSYGDNQEKFKVEIPKAQQVIFSEAYYPGWIAKVDGKKTKVEPYNIKNINMFRSLPLPAGNHIVEFDYQPFGFTN